METVPQLLESAARWRPSQPLIRFEGRTHTYGQIDAEANRIARALIERGLRAGRPVALYLPSRPIFVSCYFAAMKAGGVAAPLNAMFKPDEVAAMVNYLEAPLLITTPEMAGSLAGVRDQMPGLEAVLVWAKPCEGLPPGTKDLAALAAMMLGTALDQPFDPDGVAAVFHTSGTTGRPKGAAQTHVNIVLGARNMVSRAGWRLLRERVCSPLPLFNNFGSTAILNMVITCLGTMALVERWDAATVVRTLQGEAATRFVGTPTMYIYLLEGHAPARHGRIVLDGGIVGGQTCPSEVRDAFEQRFGGRLINLYGATETHAVTATHSHGRYPDTSVGQPIASAVVRVEDDEGGEVPPGVVGELILDADTVCAGYWQDRQRTSESFGPHGWRSGDLGYVDEDGWVFVVDRKKDLIITGGANIYPAEIEAVLYQHPSVSVATVIGIPDSVKGEIPKAYVVPKPGADVSPDELMAHTRARLAAYKCPRAVELVDSVPTSSVGKVLKRELRDQVLAAADAAITTTADEVMR